MLCHVMLCYGKISAQTSLFFISFLQNVHGYSEIMEYFTSEI